MSFDVRWESGRMLRAAWQAPVAIGLCALAVVAVGIRPELVGFLYVAVVTAELCRTDVTARRLPNALVLPGYGITATGLVFGWLRAGDPPAGALIAGCATFGFLLILGIGGGMGMGDVKLGGLLGINLGAIGVVAAIAGPVIGFVVGGIAGLVTLALPTTDRLRRIPFGPYLLFGFWSAAALPLIVHTEFII
jgi:leader peptidase (prepilin peptidase) / N-methyltransferase